MPSPRIPPSPRDAPRIFHAVLVAVGGRARSASRPPRPRWSDSERAVRRGHRDAGQPGRLLLGGVQRDDHVAVARRARVREAGRPSHSRRWLRSQCRREDSQPASSSAAGHRRLAVADLQLLDLAQRRQALGQVERRRQPLAPRRRAQPGQVDDVGVLAQALGARERLHRIVDVVGVQQHHVDRAGRQRVDRLGVAVRRPQRPSAARRRAPGRQIVCSARRCSGPRSISTLSCMTPSDAALRAPRS